MNRETTGNKWRRGAHPQESLQQETWRSEYPFESRWTDLDGWRYHHVEAGVGERPVVCVHGNPTWSFYWRSLLGALSDRTRVLAVDHLGCGLSDAPGEAYPYSLATHTENLVRWLELHDLKNVLLVVHDWGGAIGLGAYRQVPERFERLLILNTAAFPPPVTWIPLRIAACRLPWIGSWAIRQHNAFARAAIWMAMERPEGLSSVSAQGLLAPYQEPGRRIAIDRFVRDIPMTQSHPTWKVLRDLESGLKRLPPIETQLVWGMKDWCFTPRCLQRMQDVFPHASVERLEQTGHYVMEESPAAVVAAARRMLDPASHSSAPKSSGV